MELLYLRVKKYKNLKGAYPLTIKYNVIVDTQNEIALEKNDLYIKKFFDDKDKINLSAIIGENGSGKTSLLKLIMQLLYNAYEKENIIDIKDSFMIFEMDTKFYKVGSSENIRLTIDEKLISLQEYKSSFYTIYFNYMLDTLKDNLTETWIDDIYHKSDNYTVPVLLEPYKKNNMVDIDNLNYLTRQRIIGNKKEIEQNKFLQKIFSPEKVYLTIDVKKITNIFTSTNIGEKAFYLIHNVYNKELEKISDILKEISDRTKEISESREAMRVRAEKEYVEDNEEHNSINMKLVKEFEDVLGHSYQTISNLNTTLKEEIYKVEIYVLNNLYIAHKFDKLNADDRIREKTAVLEWVGFNHSISPQKIEIINSDDSHVTLKLRNAMKFFDLYYKEPFDLTSKGDFFFIEKKILNYLPSWFDVEFSDSKNRNFTSLSAGEKSFYILLTTLIYQIKNIVTRKELSDGNYQNLLIILDETDLGLHPKWQRDYIYNIIECIKDLSSKLSFHIICTSHSPFIVSDLPKGNILFLNDGIVDDLKDNQLTFGENIHSLLNDSFFMHKGMMMGKLAEKKISEVFSFFEDVFSNDKQINHITVALEKNNINSYSNEEIDGLRDNKEKLEVEKKKLKKHYLKHKDTFINLKNIVGEKYIQVSLKNSIDECDSIYQLKKKKSKEELILEALENDPKLYDKWLKEI